MDGRDGDRSNVGLLLELDSTIKAVRKQLDVFKHKNDSNCYWRMNYKGEGKQQRLLGAIMQKLTNVVVSSELLMCPTSYQVADAEVNHVNPSPYGTQIS